jgi:hypothetical protein
MASKRQLSSWLKGLAEFAEDTEAPRDFWLWAGISTIASAVQRKVWVPYGIETIYPNMYILIIGPPASRKAAPINLSKKLLQELQVTISKDSGSKRALTKQMAAAVDKEKFFEPKGQKWIGQSAISIISRELSSLLAVEPKTMIEFLTDGYDCPEDKWEYGTSEKGEDILYYHVINCLLGTTPGWFANNLPQEAVGSGWTSRHIIIFGDKVYKRVPRPELTERQKHVYKSLVNDLQLIAGLVGEMSWSKEAGEYFDNWYKDIDKNLSKIKDERLAPFGGRVHVHVIKTAIVLHLDRSSVLELEADDVGRAIELVWGTIPGASQAFGGFGPSRTSGEVHRIEQQVRIMKVVAFEELLAANLRHVNKSELVEILSTLVAAKKIQEFLDKEKGRLIYKWLG